jgi:hypothetical protein
MAVFTQTNGTTQPVFNLDVRNGSIAGTANIAAQGAVQPQGPKLDFFSLVANAAMTSAGNVNGFLQNTFQQIQSGGGIVDGGAGGTVAMYQVSPASPTVLNIAIYPTGAYTTTTLLAAARQANATGGLNLGFTSCAGNAVFTTTPLA